MGAGGFVGRPAAVWRGRQEHAAELHRRTGFLRGLHQAQKYGQRPIGERLGPQDQQEVVAGRQKLQRQLAQNGRGSVDQHPVIAVEIIGIQLVQDGGERVLPGIDVAVRNGQDVEVRQDSPIDRAFKRNAGGAQRLSVAVQIQIQGGGNRAERIGIDEQDRSAGLSGGGGEIDRRRRLAHAAFLTGDQEGRHVRSSRPVAPFGVLRGTAARRGRRCGRARRRRHRPLGRPARRTGFHRPIAHRLIVGHRRLEEQFAMHLP